MFYIFPQAVSKEDCNYFIEDCLKKYKGEMYDSVVGSSDPERFPNGVIDESYRKGKVVFLPNENDKLHKTIYSHVKEANDNFFGFRLTSHESVQFAEWNKGDFYNWHQDYQNPQHAGMSSAHFHVKGECRKLSLTLALSEFDAFEGGSLEFFNGLNGDGYTEVTIDGRKHSPKEVKDLARKQGTIIVFDSRDYHRISPVTSGTRHSLVCWTHGPHFI